jgi:hypothetical protein
MGPHGLTRELRDQRVKDAQALLDVLRQQEKTHFRDTITGDESWIFTDTAPSSIWWLFGEELPTLPRRTISTDKRMLITLWGINGFIHVNWLHMDDAKVHTAKVVSSVMPDLRIKRRPKPL